MTFTIVARCARTGRVGAAVCSSSPAVAARCIRARAGVGAAASQNVTDPALGSELLQRMEAGATASQAVDALVAGHVHVEYRQVLAVDAQGTTASFTGARGLGRVAQAHGTDAACAGNLLASDGVPAAMLEAFEQAPEANLADRLLAALHAGLDAGGEAGSVHSSGLLVADVLPWPVVDLRIDWTRGNPVAELAALWSLYAPQLESYTRRALDPAGAPSFGVAGDP